MQVHSAGWLRRGALTRRRPAWMVMVLVLGATVIGLGPSGTARAHASIESITPADGTLLREAPSSVRIVFSEPIDDVFVDAEIITATTPVDEPLVPSRDPLDANVLVIALPVLPDGSYQIGFSVRDRIDLHEVRGRTSFAVGDHAVVAASPPEVPAPQPWESVARWAFTLGMALVIGSLVVRGRWPDVPVAAPRRLAATAATGVALIALGRIGVVAARAADLDVAWRTALRTVARTGDVARLPVVAVALGCLVPVLAPHRWAWLDAPWRRGAGVSTRVALGGAGVVWLALLGGWGDHAALTGSVEPLVAVAKAAHLIGVGAWLGALAVAVVVNAGSGRVPAALRAVRREAVGGAVLAVASGLLLASRLVVSLTGAFATSFGQLLVVKLALMAGAVLLGIARRRRARGAGAEAVLLGVVVLAGAAMATAGPATGAAYLPDAASSTPQMTTTTTGDVIVRARAVPARPGPNDIELTIASSRRPAPPIDVVTVRIATPAGDRLVEVHPDDRGAAVAAGIDLPEGTSALTVSVERSGRPTVVAESTVATAPLAYHHPAIVSSAPLRTLLRSLALAVALAGVAFGMACRRRAMSSAPVAAQAQRHVHTS